SLLRPHLPAAPFSPPRPSSDPPVPAAPLRAVPRLAAQLAVRVGGEDVEPVRVPRRDRRAARDDAAEVLPRVPRRAVPPLVHQVRSEEHTSELQSLTNLVCRLLL